MAIIKAKPCDCFAKMSKIECVAVKNGKVQKLLGRAGFSASACTAENRPSFGLPFSATPIATKYKQKVSDKAPTHKIAISFHNSFILDFLHLSRVRIRVKPSVKRSILLQFIPFCPVFHVLVAVDKRLCYTLLWI